MEPTATSPGNAIANFFDYLIKNNQSVLDEIDKNQDLNKSYQADAKKMETGATKDAAEVSKELEELTGLLFNTLQTSMREDRKFKWVDAATSRSIPYQYLRAAGETETPLMIKNLRRLQLTNFSIPASTKKYGDETGFALVWKDPEYKPKPDEKATLKHYERLIQEKFFYVGGDPTPSLLRFLGTMYADFFDLDDITLKIERDGLFNPIGIHIEDPSLWFPVIPKVKQTARWNDFDTESYKEAENTQIEIPEYAYLMMRGTRKLAGATRDVLNKSHFFQRSDFTKWRRGYSIMEQATRVTTIILNAMAFNASNFSNNRTPAGVLALSGGYTSPLQLEKIKKLLWANMQGPTNQKRFPVIGLPEKSTAEWVSIHNSNKEMEFYTGMTLFISIVCALSGTSPNELGLPSFQDALKGKSLNEENKDGIWRQSQDNGLKTFLNHAEATLNKPLSDGKNVFEQATGMAVMAQFKGLAAEDAAKKAEINTKRLAIDLSVNKVREEADQEPAEYIIETPNGQVNIYDLPGLGNGNIAAFPRADQAAKIQEAAADKMMEQQNAQAGQQEENEGLTEQDRSLIDQYGEPEEA